jgi:uncharacterized protein (DUF488 family)
MNPKIYTVGHSTRKIEDFVTLLKAYKIEIVVDVRTIPKSKHNPQFGEQELSRSLGSYEIAYRRLPRLGGLRHTNKDSINTAWKNQSFRGYADYMQTEEFAQGIDELMAIAKEGRTVIMCAEAVPWRCHRSLIGDALLVRHIQVEDIISETSSRPHKMTPWARVDGEGITYPALELG